MAVTGHIEDSRCAYYASCCGYEVLFHVAPSLSDDEQRQYIGNDKILIYCLARDAAPLVPRFRGDVNSVAIVCRPAASQCKWDVNLFYRSRVECFSPVFAGRDLDPTQLQRTVLALLVNAYHAIMSSQPYSTMLAKAMDFELRAIWPSKDKERRGSTVRRSLTLTSLRQSGERLPKEGQSSSSLTLPCSKALQLFVPSSPRTPDSNPKELPFPGISLRKSGKTCVSGSSSPRDELQQSKSERSRF